MSELMTPREAARLEAIKAEAQRQMAAEMRGKVAMTPKALKLRRKIDEIDAALSAAERMAAERLALERLPFERTYEIIAIPLLADVLNDVITGVDTTLREAGIQRTVFGAAAREIRRKALWMVDTLAAADVELPDLVTDDEMLVETIKRKLFNYIQHRIKPTHK